MNDTDSIDVMDAPVGAYRAAVKACQAVQDRRRAVREEITRLLNDYRALDIESSESVEAVYAAQRAMVTAAGPEVRFDDEARYAIAKASHLTATGAP